jgi:hypothetical protein
VSRRRRGLAPSQHFDRSTPTWLMMWRWPTCQPVWLGIICVRKVHPVKHKIPEND